MRKGTDLRRFFSIGTTKEKKSGVCLFIYLNIRIHHQNSDWERDCKHKNHQKPFLCLSLSLCLFFFFFVCNQSKDESLSKNKRIKLFFNKSEFELKKTLTKETDQSKDRRISESDSIKEENERDWDFAHVQRGNKKYGIEKRE